MIEVWTRIAAGARTAVSLSVTLAIIVGTGALLLDWTGWPMPRDWPSAQQWAEIAEHPLTSGVAETAAAVAAWLLWLLLVFSVALEAWTRLSRRPPPIRLPRPMRVLAAGLLGTSLIAVSAPAHASIPVSQNPSTLPEHPPHPPAAQGASSTTPKAAVNLYSSRDPNSPDHLDGVQTPTHHSTDIPGGWIAWPLATCVLAAAATNLLHRRHPPHANKVVRAIRAAQHPSIEPTAEQPPGKPVDDLAILESEAAAVATLTFGVRDNTYLGLDELHPGGTGIIGAGGNHALRGILAAAAYTPEAKVIIPHDLWTELTGADRGLPGVTVTADASTALHALQLEVHHRYLNQHHTMGTTVGSTVDDAVGDAVGDAVHHLPLIVVTPPVHRERLAALATLGGTLRIRIIVVGSWPAGITWSVDQRGHAHTGTTTVGRLNTLDPDAFAQLTQPLQPAPQHHPVIASAPALPSSPGGPRSHLRILGPLTLATTQNKTVHIRRGGAQQIAVLLALHPDGTSRDELIETVFGHMKPHAAATSLNTCLYELRQLLTHDTHCALQRVDDTYRLDPAHITVDWWQLLDALRRGDHNEAAAAYTGTIADGHHWDWLPEHRQTARHLIADTYAQLARTAPTADQALQHALAGINIDPHAQQCYNAAIHACEQLGDTGRAAHLQHELARRLTTTTRYY